MQKKAINENVHITAWYFRNKKGLNTYPKRMEYNGASYTFLNSGLHFLVKKGESITRIFDVTDGTHDYRLKCDDEQANWTLVAMSDYA